MCIAALKEEATHPLQRFCKGGQHTWDGSDPWEGGCCLIAENLKRKILSDALVKMRNNSLKGELSIDTTLTPLSFRWTVPLKP